jgi:hypothetical protein
MQSQRCSQRSNHSAIAADQQQPSNAASQQQSCGYLCFSTILLTCGAGGASRCSPSLPETADTAPHHTDQRRRCINMPQLASVAFKAGQPARHAGGLGLYQSVVVWYRAQGTHHTLLQYSRNGCCCPLSAMLLHTGTKLDAVW